MRLPASLPYLFTALKIAATASVVGTIIGEGPGGIPDGLGRAIVNFNQQYITGPEKLWATILVASLLGISFFVVIRLAELAVAARPARRGRRVSGVDARRGPGPTLPRRSSGSPPSTRPS